MSGKESRQVTTFLVKWTPMLSQRVTGVMPIADQLLSEGVIGQELYEGIRALNTRQCQMRYLLEALRSPQEQLGLYRILQEQEPRLMEELKNSKFDLYETLDDLSEEEFKRFKDSLNQNRKGFTRIPWSKLEKADVTDTVRLMRNRYGDQQSLQLTKDIITTLKGRPATGMTQNVNALTLRNLEAEDPTSPSTSMASSVRPTALLRRWTPHSKRWCKELEELANMPEEKVTRKDSLVFVTDKPKFRIADKGHTKVFLGLRGDGREVAIKRVEKSQDKMINEEMKVLWRKMYNSLHVVQYVDYTEDQEFAYIAMQLCEYNLEEYIKADNMMTMDRKRNIVKEFLMGLKELHDGKTIQRDIKPSNVLIDKDGCVRLADFGISRTLDPDQSTIETDKAGTKCWEATEIVAKSVGWRYKRSTDIQVAGMLVYYILSGGHHPFGDDYNCQANIGNGRYSLDHLIDEEAKDLVESMVNPFKPELRPRIHEILEHPFFWNESRHRTFLKAVGDVDDVEKHMEFTADEDLDSKMKDKSFSTWKTELNHLTKDLDMKNQWLDLVKKVDKDGKKFSQSLLSLLRFIRNRMVHSKKEMENIDVLKLFPDLVMTAYKYANERGWTVEGFLPLLPAPVSKKRRLNFVDLALTHSETSTVW